MIKSVTMLQILYTIKFQNPALFLFQKKFLVILLKSQETQSSPEITFNKMIISGSTLNPIRFWTNGHQDKWTPDKWAPGQMGPRHHLIKVVNNKI